jgi:hypothetical protein
MRFRTVSVTSGVCPTQLNQKSPVLSFRFPNSSKCNSYEPARKCCIQTTFWNTKSRRCNTYRKRGGGPPASKDFSSLPSYSRL